MSHSVTSGSEESSSRSRPDRPPPAAVTNPNRSRPNGLPVRSRYRSACISALIVAARSDLRNVSMIAGLRSGWPQGTSAGIGGLGRPATTTRAPSGGLAGSNPAMLCAPGPVTPRSSSRPSTTSISSRARYTAPRHRRTIGTTAAPDALILKRRHRLAQKITKLFGDDLNKRRPVTVARETRCDEERHDPHPRRGIKHKAGQQRGLPRPLRRPPPHIRTGRRPVGGGTERGQPGQFCFPADQPGRSDLTHLLHICRPHHRYERNWGRKWGGRCYRAQPCGSRIGGLGLRLSPSEFDRVQQSPPAHLPVNVEQVHGHDQTQQPGPLAVLHSHH